MKQWTEQDLTLLYYDELPIEQRQSLLNALEQDSTLSEKYQALSQFLDQQLDIEVPAPSEQLNQRIMAGIYQQAELDLIEQAAKQKQPEPKPGFWQRLQFGKLLGAAVPLCFVVIATFYLGRWSAETEPTIAQIPAAQTDNEAQNPAEQFNSQRVLQDNLILHLQSTDRLFTQVSNTTDNLAERLEQRRQSVEEMVAINRIYRRIAEQNGDKQLADMLSQMEQILLSLKNAPANQDEKGWDRLRGRIEDTDLLFKLRVTEQTLQTI